MKILMSFLACLLAGGFWSSRGDLPAGPEPVTFTILYDNRANGNSMLADHGFSCLIELGERACLFDAGRIPATLLANAKSLGADLSRVGRVVVSHIHDDHMGSLFELLAVCRTPSLCLPFSYPQTEAEPHTERSDADFRALLDKLRPDVSDLVQRRDGGPIGDGLWTTGPIEDQSYEQALIVPTANGLVVVTGCAHPGIIEVVKRARELMKRDVSLVMGGFHLSSTAPERVEEIARELRTLTKRVGPCHCTGENARSILKEIFKDDCLDLRAGTRIVS